MIAFEQAEIEILFMQLGAPGGDFHNIQIVLKSGNKVIASFTDAKVMDEMFTDLVGQKVSGLTTTGIPNTGTKTGTKKKNSRKKS